MTIEANIQAILKSIPNHVQLMAAAKTQSLDAVESAIDAGVHLIGENYVQEMLPVYESFHNRIPVHFIGHLQTNKVKIAVAHCDMIETVDSIKLAQEIDKRAGQLNKMMPILIEINSGRESQKHGVFPEKAEALIAGLSSFPNISVRGLMTMGPWDDDDTIIKEAFRETKTLFDTLTSRAMPHASMQILSMGMSHSYRLAIEEGATVIRVGTQIFGKRQYSK